MGKRRVLPWGHTNPTQRSRLGEQGLESCPVEKDPGRWAAASSVPGWARWPAASRLGSGPVRAAGAGQGFGP